MKKNLEKKYLHLYKQYRDRKIPTEIFIDHCDELSYTDQNQQFHQLSNEGVWNLWTGNEWVFESYLTGFNKRRLNLLAGYSKPRVFMKIFAAFLAIVLLLTFVFPDTLSDGTSIVRTWFQELREYKSPSIKKEFAPGLFVKAPRGAMKEGKDIQIKEIGLDQAINEFADVGEFIVPLYAFEFDADMDADEKFLKPVDIEIDLENLTVSENGYEDLVVYRKGSDNKVELLETRVKGDKLIITTEKNSIIAITLWIGDKLLMLGIATGIGLEINDEYQKFDVNYFDYVAFSIPDIKYKNYKIYCRGETISKFSSDLDNLKAENERLMSKYGLVWSPAFQSYTIPELSLESLDQVRTIDINSVNRNNELIRDLQNDGDFDKLQKKITKDLLPPPVLVVAEAVMKAHDYLYEERNLNKIGHELDIIILDPWTYSPKAAAMETTSPTEASYIQINPTTIDTITSGNNNAKVALDDLQITVVHEMLHAIQWEYYDGEDLRISEALAMMLEAEAARYFAKKGVIKIENYKPTIRATDMLHLSWYGEVDTKTKQEHGYAFSYVLEYQRDSEIGFLGGDNKDFLLKLMNARSSNTSAGAIYSMLKESEKELMYRYLMSTEGIAAAIALDDNRELNIIKETNNPYAFTLEDEPLAINNFHTVIPTRLQGVMDPESVILYYKDGNTTSGIEMMKQHVLYTMINPDDPTFNKDKSWHEIDKSEGFHVVPLTEINVDGKNKVNRIYITDDGDALEVKKSATIKTVVATAPDPAVDITYDNDEMTFTIKVPQETVTSKDLYVGRVVELSAPGTSIVPYEVLIKAGETEIKVHLLELLLNEGDGSLFNIEAIAGKMVVGSLSLSMKTSLRAMALASNGMITAKDTGDNSMYFGIDSSYTVEDEDGKMINIVDKLREKGIPHGITSTIKSNDKNVSLNLVADYGAYLSLRAKLNDVFKYFFYTTLGNNAGIDMDKANKRLEELNNSQQVVTSVRNAFSGSTTFDIEDSVKAEESYHKTSDSILGPKSSDKTMTMPFVSTITTGLPKSTYVGNAMFKIHSNIGTVVKQYRSETKVKRNSDEKDERLLEFLETNEGYLNKLQADKGSAVVDARIKQEIEDIENDIVEDEAEFDESFYTEFDKAIKMINNMSYTLVFSDDIVTLTILDNSIKGTYAPTSKQGRYTLTFIDENKQQLVYDMVLTPEGHIILKGDYVIFK